MKDAGALEDPIGASDSDESEVEPRVDLEDMYARQEAQRDARRAKLRYRPVLAGLLLFATIPAIILTAPSSVIHEGGLPTRVVTVPPIFVVSVPSLFIAAVLCLVRRKRGISLVLSFLGFLGGLFTLVPALLAGTALLLIVFGEGDFED